MKITNEQLELLGIFKINSKIFPKRYFVPCVGEVDIEENTEIKDIFEMIWSSGHEMGKKRGMQLKIQELKQVLEIED